jgi:hypothetical protein
MNFWNILSMTGLTIIRAARASRFGIFWTANAISATKDHKDYTAP